MCTLREIPTCVKQSAAQREAWRASRNVCPHLHSDAQRVVLLIDPLSVRAALANERVMTLCGHVQQVLLIATRPGSASSLEELRRILADADKATTIFLQLSPPTLVRAKEAGDDQQQVCCLH